MDKEKTLKARHNAYRDGMDNFTMLRYTAAMESLNRTLEATLQDNELTGMVTADCASFTAAQLAAADMISSKLTGIDKTLQNLTKVLAER